MTDVYKRQDQAFGDSRAGKAGRDAGGERVDGRADDADARAEHDQGRRREAVVPGGQHHTVKMTSK